MVLLGLTPEQADRALAAASGTSRRSGSAAAVDPPPPPPQPATALQGWGPCGGGLVPQELHERASGLSQAPSQAANQAPGQYPSQDLTEELFAEGAAAHASFAGSEHDVLPSCHLTALATAATQLQLQPSPPHLQLRPGSEEFGGSRGGADTATALAPAMLSSLPPPSEAGGGGGGGAGSGGRGYDGRMVTGDSPPGSPLSRSVDVSIALEAAARFAAWQSPTGLPLKP